MCGIMGILSDGMPEHMRAAVRDMMAASGHRGPDASGSVEIPLAGSSSCAGAHATFHPRSQRRLRQPMQDAESGSWLIFNGEIYNFRQLRAELETLGAKFSTSGDTEVLLQGAGAMGRRSASKAGRDVRVCLLGWPERNLLLARDRWA